jgi:hypothetical protein
MQRDFANGERVSRALGVLEDDLGDGPVDRRVRDPADDSLTRRLHLWSFSCGSRLLRAIDTCPVECFFDGRVLGFGVGGTSGLAGDVRSQKVRNLLVPEPDGPRHQAADECLQVRHPNFDFPQLRVHLHRGGFRHHLPQGRREV